MNYDEMQEAENLIYKQNSLFAIDHIIDRLWARKFDEDLFQKVIFIFDYLKNNKFTATNKYYDHHNIFAYCSKYKQENRLVFLHGDPANPNIYLFSYNKNELFIRYLKSVKDINKQKFNAHPFDDEFVFDFIISNKSSFNAIVSHQKLKIVEVLINSLELHIRENK